MAKNRKRIVKENIKKNAKLANSEEKENEELEKDEILESMELEVNEERNQISNDKNENKGIILKQKNEISEIKLEKIEEEIKKQTTISDGKKKKIYNRIFKNIIVAIIVIIYFIFINLGYIKLTPEIYLVDQRVFSLITLGLAIIIFERAYKKDNGEIAIFGIETLALSICTLMTTYIMANHNEKYTYAITTISMLFAIYYVAKSIVIYCKMKNKALKRTSDIHKIGRIKE